MKKSFTFLQASIIILMLTFISLKASAQVATPISGPSNAVAYNASTLAADGFVCFGGTIKLTGVGDPGNRYTWYKKSPVTGLPVLVQATGAPDAATYQDPSSGFGYYTYYVEQTNANGCISPKSNAINIYVLPEIIPVINGGQDYCANALPAPANLDLTIGGLIAGYSYTYQWTEDGSNISAINGGTANHYIVNNTTANTHKYTVKVTLVLSAGLTAPCTYESLPKSIIVYLVPARPSILVN